MSSNSSEFNPGKGSGGPPMFTRGSKQGKPAEGDFKLERNANPDNATNT